MSTFEVFKSFYSEEEAAPFQELLADNGIDCKVEKTRQTIDKVIIGDSPDTDIFLKLKPEDFEKANKVIDQYIQKNIDELDADYYLFSFSDDELRDVLMKPDEWNNQDVIFAGKILNDRGRAITPEKIVSLRQERISTLAQPEKIDSTRIWIGYLLAIFLSPYGIFYSLFLLNGKKVLPNGTIVPGYPEKVRFHFRVMLAISILMVIAAIFLTLYTHMFTFSI